MPSLILILVCIVGILGFILIDKYSFLEAIYMVVVTLTTVGFRPVKEMSNAGMIFDMTFVLVGIVLVIVVIGRALEFIVSGEFVNVRRKRRMEKIIERIKDHYIICGFGRVGHQIAKDFDNGGVPYVVIDSKPETQHELEGKVPYLIGDITSDEVLEQAGIMRAKGLIACADSDTSNVYVTLSARTMNLNLFIISRAADIATETKLKKAGANRVISPYFIAGNRMASLAVRPIAVEFLDTVMKSENVELELEEYLINDGSRIVGKTLEELEIKQKTGAMILAVKQSSGKFNLQPGAKTTINNGDVMVALGTSEQLEKLREMAEGS